MKYSGTIHVVFDGMWGDCGKGKVVSQLALDPKLNIKICVNQNPANVDHTITLENNEKVTLRHLPCGVINPNIPYLVIGQEGRINVEILKKELERNKKLIGDRKIYISSHAAIIENKHIKADISSVKTGSTYSGSGASLVGKIMRTDNLAQDNEELKQLEKEGKIKIIGPNFFPMFYASGSNEDILVEGSQGWGLGLNTDSYPYVTSRDCNPGFYLQAIHAADKGFNIKKYCVFRPYPIRISNNSVAGYVYTGNFDGAKEIEWKEIAKRCNMPESEIKKIEEQDSTHGLRRVSEFCVKEFMEMLLDTTPDELYLNFPQYVDFGFNGLTTEKVKDIQNRFCNPDLYSDYNEYGKIAQTNWSIEHVLGYIEEIEEFFKKEFSKRNLDVNVNVSMIGTGPKASEFIYRNQIKQTSINNHAMKDINPLDYADKDNVLDEEKIVIFNKKR